MLQNSALDSRRRLTSQTHVADSRRRLTRGNLCRNGAWTQITRSCGHKVTRADAQFIASTGVEGATFFRPVWAQDNLSKSSRAHAEWVVICGQVVAYHACRSSDWVVLFRGWYDDVCIMGTGSQPAVNRYRADSMCFTYGYSAVVACSRRVAYGWI